MKYIILLLLPSILFFTGCSSNGIQADDGAAQSSFSSTRQIIRTASINISVENIDEKAASLYALVKQYGGYVNSSNRHIEKRVSLDVKIPSEKLDTFINNVSSIGEITYKSTNSKDVTEQVVDIEARIENLISLRERYRELLIKANKVAEVIQIEKELSEIQTELDSIEGRRKSLLDQVAMSSVNISLEQRIIYGPLGYLGKGVIWVIGKLFIIK